MNDMKNQSQLYIYKDHNEYKIHDNSIGFDYHISKCDIIHNIHIQKNLTGIALWYNVSLDVIGNIVLN